MVDWRDKFKEYWESEGKLGLGVFEMRLAEDIARTAFCRGVAQGEKGDWFRKVCAEEMGVDAPGGNACHPLREWLRSFKMLSSAKQAAQTVELLKELAQRGGAAAALGRAGLLFEAKGQDYNVGISRDDYFPLGLSSYAQMIWVKALRLVSFAKTPRPPRHEDVSETLLDAINYAAFAWDWLQRQPKAAEKLAEERRA